MKICVDIYERNSFTRSRSFGKIFMISKAEEKLMADILLVEDEESVSRGIEVTHTKEGYQVDTEIDQVMGYETGADDYVTKPFSLSVLVLKANPANAEKNAGCKEGTHGVFNFQC